MKRNIFLIIALGFFPMQLLAHNPAGAFATYGIVLFVSSLFSLYSVLILKKILKINNLFWKTSIIVVLAILTFVLTLYFLVFDALEWIYLTFFG